MLTDFETQAKRYHQDTFKRKLEDLRNTVDLRLHVLFRAQITGLHSLCLKTFQEQVEMGLKKGGEFAITVMGVRITSNARIRHRSKICGCRRNRLDF